jgi:hypothetical protein
MWLDLVHKKVRLMLRIVRFYGAPGQLAVSKVRCVAGKWLGVCGRLPTHTGKSRLWRAQIREAFAPARDHTLIALAGRASRSAVWGTLRPHRVSEGPSDSLIRHPHDLSTPTHDSQKGMAQLAQACESCKSLPKGARTYFMAALILPLSNVRAKHLWDLPPSRSAPSRRRSNKNMTCTRNCLRSDDHHLGTLCGGQASFRRQRLLPMCNHPSKV